MLCQKSNFTCVENVLWRKHLFVLKQLWLSLFSCASQIKYDRIRQTLSKYNERVFFFSITMQIYGVTHLLPLWRILPRSPNTFSWDGLCVRTGSFGMFSHHQHSFARSTTLHWWKWRVCAEFWLNLPYLPHFQLGRQSVLDAVLWKSRKSRL